MHKMSRLLFALIVLVTCKGAIAGSKVTPLLTSELQYTCGCNFQLPGKSRGESTFLQWSDGEEAFMRIDGKLEKFPVESIKSKIKKTGKISLGDTDTYFLKNELFQVSVHSKVVQICTPKNTECESVGLSARVVVTSSLGSTSINATGACGC